MRYLIVLLLLTGCATAEERAARGAEVRERMLTNADAMCSRMGFKAGSAEHSNCQMDLIKTSINASTNAPRPSVVMPMPRSTTCTSAGNTTNCY